LIETNRDTQTTGHGVDRIWQMWVEETLAGKSEPAR
jgi:hypothetical protein